MKISIIVPAHNEEKYIKQCIDSLLKQSYKRYEIVVVVDGSEDKTSAIVKKYKPAKVKIVYDERALGSAGARNRGIYESDGEIVAFIDADCVADKDWLKNLVNVLKKFDAAVGHSFSFKESVWAKIQDKEYQGWLRKNHRGERILAFDTRNAAVRRKVLEEIEGFDENLKVSVDHELGIRLMKKGIRIGFADKAKVKHHDKLRLRDYYRWARDSVTSHYFVSRKHGKKLPYSIRKGEQFAFSLFLLITTWVLSYSFGLPYLLLIFGAGILIYSIIPELRSFIGFLAGKKKYNEFIFSIAKEKGYKIGTLKHAISLR